MKVCILGDSLTSLTLAKALINKGIYVDVFFNKQIKKQDKSRTLGISKSNIEFFNKDILNIEKFLWDIKKIEIFSQNLNNEKLLQFQNNDDRLFSIIRNFELTNQLFSEIKKNPHSKLKSFSGSFSSIKNKYELIINCDLKNQLTKRFFSRRFSKDYDSNAYTAIMEHAEISKNHVASQIFTKNGPLAFLPISNKKTSLVYSFTGKKNFDFKKEIQKFNYKYKIKKIGDVKEIKLISSDLRNYHYENILAFGDLLHKIHPLAGQGFNMSIRDIKELLKIIQFKIDHGLNLDKSICLEFEKIRKHKNYIFTNGINFIYEFFKIESKIKNKSISKLIKSLGNNEIIKKTFTKFADNGIFI